MAVGFLIGNCQEFPFLSLLTLLRYDYAPPAEDHGRVG